MRSHKKPEPDASDTGRKIELVVPNKTTINISESKLDIWDKRVRIFSPIITLVAAGFGIYQIVNAINLSKDQYKLAQDQYNISKDQEKRVLDSTKSDEDLKRQTQYASAVAGLANDNEFIRLSSVMTMINLSHSDDEKYKSIQIFGSYLRARYPAQVAIKALGCGQRELVTREDENEILKFSANFSSNMDILKYGDSLNFSNIDFSGLTVRFFNLTNFNFSNSIFQHSFFRDTSISRSELDNTYFNDINFQSAYVENVYGSNVKFYNSSWYVIHFKGDVDGISLNCSNITLSSISSIGDVNVFKTDISNTSLTDAYLYYQGASDNYDSNDNSLRIIDSHTSEVISVFNNYDIKNSVINHSFLCGTNNTTVNSINKMLSNLKKPGTEISLLKNSSICKNRHF